MHYNSLLFLQGRPFTPTTLTPKQPIIFDISDLFLDPEQVTREFNQPLRPSPGSPMTFEAAGFAVADFVGYCAMVRFLVIRYR